MEPKSNKFKSIHQKPCRQKYTIYAIMIKESNPKQTVLDFYLPFDGHLDPDNRWVKLADQIPWEALGNIYNQSLSNKKGE